MKTISRGLLLGVPFVAFALGLHAQFAFVTNAAGTITITSYTGAGGAVSIPPFLGGLPVTSLETNSFYLATNVTSVTVPDSVTNIGTGAFEGCVSMTSITLPQNLGSINSSVFQSCFQLSSISIPTTVTNLGNSTFYNCFSLHSIYIPANVASVGLAVFDGCLNLTRARIPSLVASVPPAAFANCYGLTNVIIAGPVTNLGTQAFYNCPSLTSLVFAGNAPEADKSVFQSDNQPIVYYETNTTGWDAFSASTGLQVILWNPVIQQPQAVSTGNNVTLSFYINGTPNIPILVEAGPTLLAGSWIPLQSFALTNGSVYFTDSNAATVPSRFYRIAFP
jgi:hypothetical protein